MTELIFMLTHHDVTIPNALEVFEEAKDSGVRFVGCKDIGLPMDELRDLFDRMREAGITTFLEVVSNDKDRHFSGVRKAMELHADFLIGGMPNYTIQTLDHLRKNKSDVKFFPYIGEVIGHPCILKGNIDAIVQNGIKCQELGVDGINLLLYRYSGSATLLLEGLTNVLKIPLIVAGNIDSFERISFLRARDIWAFTIGGAILEKKFSPKPTIRDQLTAVLEKLH